MKVCSVCGNEKSLDEFYRRKASFDGLSYRCKECTRSDRRTRYANNKEADLERSRKWKADNRERISSYRKTSYRENPDKFRKQSLESRRRRLEKVMEYDRRYKSANRQRCTFHENTRRARLRSAGGSFTTAEWNQLCAFHGNRCLCCGRSSKDVKLTIDHVIPVSKGGMNNIDNIQPLCLGCNSRKKDKVIDYRGASHVLANV